MEASTVKNLLFLVLFNYFCMASGNVFEILGFEIKKKEFTKKISSEKYLPRSNF